MKRTSNPPPPRRRALTATMRVLRAPANSKKNKTAAGLGLTSRVGRRKPYTAIGIRRLKCQRCGAKAHAQWDCCANGNRKVPVCVDCDIELNRIAMEFFKVPGWKALLAKYAAGLSE